MAHGRRFVIGFAVVALVAGTAAGAQAASSGWRIVASPSPGSSANDLNSVVMTRDRGWAVGYSQTAQATRTLIERYSAASGRWNVVQSPNPSGGEQLFAVAGGDRNAWAVGGNYGTGHPVALHWNGSTWKIVSVPAVRGELSGVSIRSSGDVWAVGSRTNQANISVPWTIHWDGTRWRAVASPDPGTVGSATLSSVAVVPGTAQVLAVGSADDQGRGSGKAFAERWTGHKWVLMSMPKVPGHVDNLDGVAAISRTDAWAVGSVYWTSPHTLALHWNGTAWKRVVTPDPGNGGLAAVAVLAVSSVWAVGVDQPSGSAWTKPLILHWNGRGWVNAHAPAAPTGTGGGCGLSDGYQGLQGVATTPRSSAATAVGYHDRLTCGVPRRTLIEQRP